MKATGDIAAFGGSGHRSGPGLQNPPSKRHREDPAVRADGGSQRLCLSGGTCAHTGHSVWISSLGPSCERPCLGRRLRE